MKNPISCEKKITRIFSGKVHQASRGWYVQFDCIKTQLPRIRAPQQTKMTDLSFEIREEHAWATGELPADAVVERTSEGKILGTETKTPQERLASERMALQLSKQHLKEFSQTLKLTRTKIKATAQSVPVVTDPSDSELVARQTEALDHYKKKVNEGIAENKKHQLDLKKKAEELERKVR